MVMVPRMRLEREALLVVRPSFMEHEDPVSTCDWIPPAGPTSEELRDIWLLCALVGHEDAERVKWRDSAFNEVEAAKLLETVVSHARSPRLQPS